MPIVVQHDPDIAVVGRIAERAGQGEFNKYKQEFEFRNQQFKQQIYQAKQNAFWQGFGSVTSAIQPIMQMRSREKMMREGWQFQKEQQGRAFDQQWDMAWMGNEWQAERDYRLADLGEEADWRRFDQAEQADWRRFDMRGVEAQEAHGYGVDMFNMRSRQQKDMAAANQQWTKELQKLGFDQSKISAEQGYQNRLGLLQRQHTLGQQELAARSAEEVSRAQQLAPLLTDIIMERDPNLSREQATNVAMALNDQGRNILLNRWVGTNQSTALFRQRFSPQAFEMSAQVALEKIQNKEKFDSDLMNMAFSDMMRDAADGNLDIRDPKIHDKAEQILAIVRKSSAASGNQRTFAEVAKSQSADMGTIMNNPALKGVIAMPDGRGGFRITDLRQTSTQKPHWSTNHEGRMTNESSVRRVYDGIMSDMRAKQDRHNQAETQKQSSGTMAGRDYEPQFPHDEIKPRAVWDRMRTVAPEAYETARMMGLVPKPSAGPGGDPTTQAPARDTYYDALRQSYQGAQNLGRIPSQVASTPIYDPSQRGNQQGYGHMGYQNVQQAGQNPQYKAGKLIQYYNLGNRRPIKDPIATEAALLHGYPPIEGGYVAKPNQDGPFEARGGIPRVVAAYKDEAERWEGIGKYSPESIQQRSPAPPLPVRSGLPTPVPQPGGSASVHPAQPGPPQAMQQAVTSTGTSAPQIQILDQARTPVREWPPNTRHYATAAHNLVRRKSKGDEKSGVRRDPTFQFTAEGKSWNLFDYVNHRLQRSNSVISSLDSQQAVDRMSRQTVFLQNIGDKNSEVYLNTLNDLKWHTAVLMSDQMRKYAYDPRTRTVKWGLMPFLYSPSGGDIGEDARIFFPGLGGHNVEWNRAPAGLIYVAPNMIQKPVGATQTIFGDSDPKPDVSLHIMGFKERVRRAMRGRGTTD